MVGSAPENLESCRHVVDIKPDTEMFDSQSSISIPVSQNISDTKDPVETSINDTKVINIGSPETVYGTYDETTQTVTIIVPSEDGVCFEEAVQEVITSDSEEVLSPSCKEEPNDYNCSPISCPSFEKCGLTDYIIKAEAPLSDGGYESVGSPDSEVSESGDLSNLWNECFSELFPSLA